MTTQIMANRVIQSFFKSAKILSGKPMYKVFNRKVVVNVPYFCTQNIGLTETQTNALGMAVARLFGTQVELRLVRLQYPYLDSAILAQYIALNAGNYNFLRMQKMLFNKVSLASTNSLPHQTMGIKVELAGRLPTQRSIPRKTVENGHIGSFSSTSGQPLDFNQYASKNKLNAFTIKVWLSHKS